MKLFEVRLEVVGYAYAHDKKEVEGLTEDLLDFGTLGKLHIVSVQHNTPRLEGWDDGYPVTNLEGPTPTVAEVWPEDTTPDPRQLVFLGMVPQTP